jgi:hypothetical protein
MAGIPHQPLDVHTIPFLTLPSVPFTARTRLPHCAAIYFVLNASGTVLYVGQSIDIASRWIKHHHEITLANRQATRIAWLVMDDVSLLDAIEDACIAYFAPACNGAHPDLYPQSNDAAPIRLKRGPLPRYGPMAPARLYLPEALLEWAKRQPEGLAALVRRLLGEERDRQRQGG